MTDRAEVEAIEAALERGEDGPRPEGYVIIEAGTPEQQEEDVFTLLLSDASGRAVA